MNFDHQNRTRATSIAIQWIVISAFLVALASYVVNALLA